MVILHGHIEWHQPGLLRAQCRQLIHTCALEVEPSAVKSEVVRVTRGCACGITEGLAGDLSIQNSTFLIGRAGSLAARHYAQGCIALTQAATSLISPEALAWLIVAALIITTAVLSRHADTGTEDITLIAHAGLYTGSSAFYLLVREWAGRLAWTGTIVIVTVRLTGEC